MGPLWILALAFWLALVAGFEPLLLHREGLVLGLALSVFLALLSETRFRK